MFRWMLPSANTPRVQAAEESVREKDAQAAGVDEILDRIAAELARRGMMTPAILFIELNRPLSFLASQTAHVLFPFLAPLLGPGLAQQLAQLLEDPANVDRLLERIERLSAKESA